MPSSRLSFPCSRHFIYQQLICCGETWSRYKPDNEPQQPESWQSLEQLACTILDPLVDTFGPLTLTFGFCSQQLTCLIKKNPHPRIAPKLDQHASHELNGRGKHICSRLGAAIDLYIPNMSSYQLAIWIANQLPFDRLYLYGPERPLHVSIGPEHQRQIVLLKEKNGRRIPCRLTLDQLIVLHKETTQCSQQNSFANM